jgi:hypothetical protein
MRILYPVLAWALSGGGDPVALLWAMPAVNVLAFGAIAALGAVFAARSGRSAWWGLLVPFLLNAGTPALQDLTDTLATAAVLGFLVAWHLRWGAVVAALLAAAAVFARETNVAAVGVVLAAAAVGRDWRRAGLLAAVLAAWAGWVACLWWAYGAWPFVPGNFGPPLVGLRAQLETLPRGGRMQPFSLACTGVLVAVAAVMPFLRAGRVPAALALLGAGMFLCASGWILGDWSSHTRVFTFLPLGVLLWAVQSGRRWPLLAMLPALVFPVAAVAWVWRH